MKIDRLLSMTILLLNRRKMTAKDLADYFEVSVRTIYRDTETLNRSGIPIVSFQGYGGGFCIPDHYKLSRQILTFSDMVSIVTTLKGVNKTLNNKEIAQAIEKITALIPREKEDQFHQRENSFLIDIQPWGGPGQGHNQDLLGIIHDGVNLSREISFAYFKPGQPPEKRTIEPHTLVFKGWAWYVLGFCKSKEAFRIFKLSRMRDPILDDLYFIRKKVVPEQYFQRDNHPGPKTTFVLKFPESLRVLIEESFDPQTISPKNNEIEANDHFLLTLTLPANNWIHSFILGFGPNIEVISPPELRAAIAAKIKKMETLYTNLT